MHELTGKSRCNAQCKAELDGSYSIDDLSFDKPWLAWMVADGLSPGGFARLMSAYRGDAVAAPRLPCT